MNRSYLIGAVLALLATQQTLADDPNTLLRRASRYLEPLPAAMPGGRGKHEKQSALGRYQVTKKDNDRMVFKVPSSRNVTLTAP